MKDRRDQWVSRRRVLKACMGMPAASLYSGSRALGQNAVSAPGLALAEEYKGSQLYAISPNGDRVCLYSFKHVENFLRPWSYDGGETKKTDDVLRVIDLKTGKAACATQLRSLLVAASFFADGIRIYAESLPLREREGARGGLTVQRVIIDSHARSLTERLMGIDTVSTQYVALAWPNLLGIESSLQTARAFALTRLSLPGYEELTRVPFAPEQEPSHFGNPAVSGNGQYVYGHDTDLVVSADRRLVAYGAGHQIVFRRTSDLKVLWSRRIPGDYFGTWILDLTPDGTRVVAAVIDDTNVEKQKNFYIAVYSGEDGSVVKELPLNGFEGVSISSNGKLVGVSKRVATDDGKVAPTVDIHEVASGRLVYRVSHPPVDVHVNGGYGLGSISSRFTPDGKHLLTSGQHLTRVWNV